MIYNCPECQHCNERREQIYRLKSDKEELLRDIKLYKDERKKIIKILDIKIKKLESVLPYKLEFGGRQNGKFYYSQYLLQLQLYKEMRSFYE